MQQLDIDWYSAIGKLNTNMWKYWKVLIWGSDRVRIQGYIIFFPLNGKPIDRCNIKTLKDTNRHIMQRMCIAASEAQISFSNTVVESMELELGLYNIQPVYVELKYP